MSHICVMKNSPHFPSDACMRRKSLYFSYRSRGRPTKQCQAKMSFKSEDPSFHSVILFFVIITWWRHQMETFPVLLTLCPGNSQRQVTRALMFSLTCAWINAWENNREAGDLRRHRAHYDVIVMHSFRLVPVVNNCIFFFIQTALQIENNRHFAYHGYTMRKILPLCRKNSHL